MGFSPLSIVGPAVAQEYTSREYYNGSIFIGDSIMDGIAYYKYIDTPQVMADGNNTTDKADRYIETAVNLKPAKVFIMVGLNDVNYGTRSAQTIAEKLGVASVDVIDASKITTEKVESYDILLLGTSTWGDGELQDDWYDAIKMIKTADLNGKIVALFGCGDSESYCDTFCDGMGVIYDQLKNSGCTFVGAVSADGYSYSSSIAIIDGKFVGLALDDVNESGKTEERINSWVEEIKKNL